MKRILGRRPSPAMVIALIALFSSLGGVSYGLATNSIGSREVRNDSLTGADINERTLAPYTMAALVGADGRLLRRSVRGISSRKIGNGTYEVRFPRNVNRCSYAATPGSSGALNGITAVPANQDVGIAPSSRTRRGVVYVTAEDDTRNGPPFANNVPVYVVVVC